jgi:hypothetical protein
MHVNDAMKLVRAFFVRISLIGQPHLGQFIGDSLLPSAP